MSIFLSEEAFYIIHRLRKNNTICFVYENEEIEIEKRDLWIIIYKQKEYHYLHYFLQEEDTILFTKYRLREYGQFSQISHQNRKILSLITTKENISQIHVKPILSFLSNISNLLE
jgi:hypothetical protein